MKEMMYRKYSQELLNETATPFGEEHEGEEGLGGLFGSHAKGEASTSRTEQPPLAGEVEISQVPPP